MVANHCLGPYKQNWLDHLNDRIKEVYWPGRRIVHVIAYIPPPFIRVGCKKERYPGVQLAAVEEEKFVKSEFSLEWSTTTRDTFEAASIVS